MTRSDAAIDSPLWVGLLTIGSALATLALACATPFSSLAAIAATRMPVRAGVTLMVLAWAASQAVGFGVLGYPRDPTTLAWAFAMLTAALLSFVAARVADRMIGMTGSLARTATAFVCAFLAYRAGLLAWSLLLGGVHTAISAHWALQQFGREAMFTVTFLLLHDCLVAIGLPAAGSPRAA